MQTIKAWQLERLGGELRLADIPAPDARPGTVVVRVEASSLLSYQRDYVRGRLPHYQPPDHPFTIGSNAVGTIQAVGRDVWHLQVGQRVAISPHITANERVTEPGTFLLGLTAYGAPARRMQAEFPDGTFADAVLVPAACVTPIPASLTDRPATELVVAGRFLVPYGGFLRGRLAPGETVVVTGATGSFGGSAVLLALALGAARVVAAGRDRDALAALARLAASRGGEPRIVPVVLAGDAAKDVANLRDAAGGAADLAFDMIGRATDPNATLAGLRSLRRGGRLVLMGSMTVPLPLDYSEVLLGDLEILGQFMYPADAFRRLLALVASGLLDLRAVTTTTFRLAELPAALDAAAEAPSMHSVVLVP